MTSVSQTLALIALAVCMASCSGPRARDFAGKGPRLDPKAYFSGHIRSWGMVEDRSGKVRDQFSTHMHGTPRSNGLRLTQDFTFASGRHEHRVWDIRVIDAHHFEGQANDSVGLAHGEAWGNAFEWNYTLAVPVGSHTFNVNFRQIMLLQPDGILLNRVQYRKFGLRLGSVSECFRK
ncbi:DUF3833 family protein [Prosthecobacter sp.]|uniref:DUF3833 family protein n=1 Tax=Prosthecobacter sp. TaxID=1965333 RepID=UPI002487FE70|nr:DUF3833 family protein [Prosthecobacter sp.]MDI1311169.1 DUF3833 family protein [Prosthecobacter sp.]